MSSPTPTSQTCSPSQKVLREITAKLYRNPTNPCLVNSSKLESKKVTCEEKKETNKDKHFMTGVTPSSESEYFEIFE